MDKPWKVIVAFVGVFIAGAVFGGFFTLRASARRMAEHRQPERELRLPVPPPQPQAQPPAPKAAQGPQGRAPVVMRQINQRLNLTSAQREKIRPLIERATEDLQRLRQANERFRQQNFADTTRITQRMYSDIAGILSPEQRSELDSMRKQMQDRMEQDRKRRADIAAQIAAQAAEGGRSGGPNRHRTTQVPVEETRAEPAPENRK